MTKKIFITGGTGFIGRNLTEQLAGDYRIATPSHGELELLDEDAVRRFLERGMFDVVIHSATWNATRNSKKDLGKVLHNNLRMFFNIARHSRLYGKMICFGSGNEYDKRNYIPRMKEEHFDAYVPVDDSGFSKYIMSKYIEKSENIYKLRLFAVFGRYEDWEIRFISNACCKAAWDLPITIKQNVLFDYMYIDDLAKIIRHFIEKEPEERTYNICTGRTNDLLTLAGKVLAVSGKRLEIKIGRDGLGREYSGDNSRMLKELNGFTFADLDSSISKLYHWYLDNKASIDTEKLLIDK